ncbi:MAG TPA: hypothetical protein VEU62_12795 [Bryobacterales bacterium]|nr:hypothetical protein [Bryobacterales bacterium]
MDKPHRESARHTAGQPADREADVIAILRPLLAVAGLAGMLCSARLWVSSHRLFPLTPVFRWLPQPPFPFDYALFGAVLACLAGIALYPRPAPFLKAFLILAGVLALLDQSRWQPWLIEYGVMFGALLLLPWGRRAEWTGRDTSAALHPCRLFLICMYFYSGLQKLGYGFVLVLGEMLQPMFERLHWSTAWLAPQKLLPVAIVMALVECGSGLLLAFPRTRRIGVVCLVLMHVSLLAWLGPLALNWNYVIWPWNLAMIALLALLFWRPGRWGFRALAGSHAYAAGVAIVFGVLPVLTMLGLGDSYLGFSLYTGNVKGGAVYVGPKHIAELPPGVRPFAKADGVVDIDRWSRAELGVPVYPETRVFVSAGRQLALWVAPDTPVRVIELEKPDPFTGERKATGYDPLTY